MQDKLTIDRGAWLQTYTGLCYYPLAPRPEDVVLEDIAHALSNQCRYSGHTRCFYSVAEHAVRVSRAIEVKLRGQDIPEDVIRINAFCGLHHDDSEAYLVDLPRPIKRWSELGNCYRAIEERNMVVICQRFDLPWPLPEIVDDLDMVLMLTEKRDLMVRGTNEWTDVGNNPDPLPEIIIPWTPREAEAIYRERHYQLRAI